MAGRKGVEPWPILTNRLLSKQMLRPLSRTSQWRVAEESNPIPVKRTWFSRPVAGPTPLHYFPRFYSFSASLARFSAKAVSRLITSSESIQMSLLCIIDSISESVRKSA